MRPLVLLFAAIGCAPLPPGDPAHPDVVLVSIDSLRADHVGSYGNPRPTTPNLDRLAADGLRFTDARSASPWTLPSHMTMLTGLWPTEHQVIEDDLALDPSVPLVQEALQGAGYATGGFVSTIYVSGGYGFSRGFDHYEDYGITEGTNLEHSVRVPQVMEDALSWVEDNGRKKPVFLFLHIYDVHYPYNPPPPWNEKFDRADTTVALKYRNYFHYLKFPVAPKRMQHLQAQYDESLAWVDDHLGKLVDAFRRSDRTTNWIVTADHGEEFGERGSWGHAHTLNDEALHVPLVVAGPGVAAAVRDERVGTVDVAATIAGMAGVPWAHGDGVDVRGVVPERTLYAETSRFDTARLSILTGDRRLDLDLGGKSRTLYDTRGDPHERAPLAAGPENDAAADALETRLWSTFGTPWAATGGSVSTSGWLTRGGVNLGKQAAGPIQFGVYPPDATVQLAGAPAEGAPVAGAAVVPVEIDGVAHAPQAGPLRYEGPRRAISHTLDDATRAQLEALGYIQGDQ